MQNENYFLMFPELKFAIVKFQATSLSIEEAKRINYEYKIDKKYPKIEKLLVIIDEKCIPQFNLNDLLLISDLYNTPLQENNHQTIVWLVSAPMVTAFTQLLVSKSRDNNLYCSTREKAYDLLNLPMNFDEFKLMVTHL